MTSSAKKHIDLNVTLDLLEKILRAQLEQHERLLSCIDRKRDAIRSADIRALEQVVGEENKIAQKITELEKHRLGLIGQITGALQPKASKPLTVSEIAQTRPEPQQARLLTLAAQLRERLQQVKSQSSIVRAAAEALNRHLAGVVQTVNAAMSRARVYSQRGRIATGTPVAFTVDVKT